MLATSNSQNLTNDLDGKNERQTFVTRSNDFVKLSPMWLLLHCLLVMNILNVKS